MNCVRSQIWLWSLLCVWTCAYLAHAAHTGFEGYHTGAEGAAVSQAVTILTSAHVAIIGTISIVVILLLAILLVQGCAFCTNPEVSSETHPACASPSSKGTGSSHEPFSGRQQFVSGEATNQAQPGLHQTPLNSVPVQAAFQGYSSGFQGYQSSFGPTGSGDRGFSPMELPPPYSK